MKGIGYKIIFVASILLVVGGILNYLYYYVYPGSHPHLYTGDGITLVAYTTISGKYIVVVPVVNNMKNLSGWNYSYVNIGGYTASFTKYQLVPEVSATVAIIPMEATMINYAQIGTHTLTLVNTNIINGIQECKQKAELSKYIIFAGIAVLFVDPLYSKILIFYERFKVEREEKLRKRREEYESEDEEEEEEDAIIEELLPDVVSRNKMFRG